MNSVTNFSRSLINNLIMFSLFFVPRSNNSKKKLLLIKLEGLGDFIIFIPSLIKYKHIFPNHEITLLVDNKINYEIANRYKEVALDNVILFDAKKFSKNLIYRFIFSRKFYYSNYDTVINPIYYRRKISDFIVRATKAKERISFAGYEVEKLGRPFILKPYTKLIRVPTTIGNEFYRHKYLIESIAEKTFNDYSTTFPLKESDVVSGKEILSEYQITPDSFVVIFPGAGRDVSKWPADKFAKIAEYLIKQNISVIICGSKTEGVIAQQILQLVDKSKLSHIHNLTSKTDIFSTAGIIKLSKFYIGNDSGPTHLAEALGVTVICPLGLGHFKEFYPSQDTERNVVVSAQNLSCLNDAYACAKGLPAGNPAPCVNNITTGAVIDEINKLI